jgi:hypothetical protein
MNPAYHKPVFEYIPTGKPTDFWVITAYNPDGKNTDHDTNAAADARLHADITALGFAPFRIIGMSPDQTHAEPGWGFPCDEATALELGRSHRQEAIFHFHASGIDLVDCESGESQPLDEPAGRILDPRENRHFTLFVGSPPDRDEISPHEYDGIRSCVGVLFPGFTIQKGEGCFRSRSEETLVIHIASREPAKVIELAHQLRLLLKQTGIGISHNGIYQRVREWSDDSLILESFGLG